MSSPPLDPWVPPAVVKLHETNAALDEPAGEQTVLANDALRLRPVIS